VGCRLAEEQVEEEVGVVGEVEVGFVTVEAFQKEHWKAEQTEELAVQHLQDQYLRHLQSLLKGR
jgi:hypothetical protein